MAAGQPAVILDYDCQFGDARDFVRHVRAVRRIDELQRINFGVHEEHMRYKGTMVREGSDLAPHYRYAGDGFPGAPQVVETAAAD